MPEDNGDGDGSDLMASNTSTSSVVNDDGSDALSNVTDNTIVLWMDPPIKTLY
jgi:hypothetical protein